MTSHRIVGLLIFALLGSALPAATKCDSLDSVQWMLGDWVADGKRFQTFESWRRVTATTFEGTSEARAKDSDDVRGRESMRLAEMGGEIFFIAKPSQNEFPTGFKLTVCSEGAAVFENATHDFPRKLDYQLNEDGTIKVIVSDGGEKGFQLNFKRLTAN